MDYIRKRFDKMVTIRGFRKEVKIPDASFVSEHQLHDVSTGER